MNIGQTAAASAATHGLTGARSPGGDLGKDEFLQLLVAQLRHQDPLQPMEAQDLAVQLAQFSSVEQLMQLNESLGQTAAFNKVLAGALNADAAVGLIGKQVGAAGDQLLLPEDGSDASARFELDAAAGATLRIFDASGAEVGRRSLGQLPAGRHTVPVGEAALGLDPGVYRFEIEAEDAAGQPVTAVPLVTGVVDGVRYGEQGPILQIGPLEIALSNVIEVNRGL